MLLARYLPPSFIANHCGDATAGRSLGVVSLVCLAFGEVQPGAVGCSVFAW